VLEQAAANGVKPPVLESRGDLSSALCATIDPVVLNKRLIDANGCVQEDAQQHIEACVRALVEQSTAHIKDEELLRELLAVWSLAGNFACAYIEQLMRLGCVHCSGASSLWHLAEDARIVSHEEISTDGDHRVVCKMQLGAEGADKMVLRGIHGEYTPTLTVVQRSSGRDLAEFGGNLLESTQAQWADLLVALGDENVSMYEAVAFVCYSTGVMCEMVLDENFQKYEDLPAGWSSWAESPAKLQALTTKGAR
jgi:hypothetical protein